VLIEYLDMEQPPKPNAWGPPSAVAPPRAIVSQEPPQEHQEPIAEPTIAISNVADSIESSSQASSVPPAAVTWTPPNTSKPRPRVGYTCKVCGKPGGLPDSHWFQLCPFQQGTMPPTISSLSSSTQNFQPPKVGYICKHCGTAGGQPNSHWFQQCPYAGMYVADSVYHQSPVMMPNPYEYAAHQMYFPMQVEENNSNLTIDSNPEMHHYLIGNVLMSPAGPSPMMFSHQLAHAMGADENPNERTNQQ